MLGALALLAAQGGSAAPESVEGSYGNKEFAFGFRATNSPQTDATKNGTCWTWVKADSGVDGAQLNVAQSLTFTDAKHAQVVGLGTEHVLYTEPSGWKTGCKVYGTLTVTFALGPNDDETTWAFVPKADDKNAKHAISGQIVRRTFPKANREGRTLTVVSPFTPILWLNPGSLERGVALNFGSQRWGSVTELTFTVRNAGPKRSSLSFEVPPLPPPFELEPRTAAPLPGGSGQVFHIRFKPLKPNVGEESAQMSVETNDHGDVVQLPLKLTASAEAVNPT